MLKETSDIILDKPVYKFKVTIPGKKKLFRKSEPKTYDFEIKNLCLHAMIEISREVLEINPERIKGDIINATYNILLESGESVMKIIAYAILNNGKEPSDELLNVIGYMNSVDLKEAYRAVLEQLDVTDFISSIILIRNVNLMEMNPKDEGS